MNRSSPSELKIIKMIMYSENVVLLENYSLAEISFIIEKRENGEKIWRPSMKSY